jgi:hypothetical protein
MRESDAHCAPAAAAAVVDDVIGSGVVRYSSLSLAVPVPRISFTENHEVDQRDDDDSVTPILQKQQSQIWT